MPHVKFNYVAGKVAGAFGNYTDAIVAFGPPYSGPIPRVDLYIGPNGTYTAYTASAGVIENGRWYTGGTPSGPTTFQLQVLNNSVFFGGLAAASTTFSHASGSYTSTSGFSLWIEAPSPNLSGDLPPRGQGYMDCNLSITRGGQTMSYSFQLEVAVEV